MIKIVLNVNWVDMRYWRHVASNGPTFDLVLRVYPNIAESNAAQRCKPTRKRLKACMTKASREGVLLAEMHKKVASGSGLTDQWLGIE